MWARRRAERERGLAAIGVHALGLSFVLVRRPSRGAPEVAAAEFRPFADAEPARVLADLASDHDLRHTRATTLLSEGDYRLIQTEAPDVKADELKAALRWRVKDLIDFHINDATLDVFDVPVQTPGRAVLVSVVVGRNEAIRRRVEFLEEAGVALDIIDIPDLAQRNLAALLPEEQDGVALLTLAEDTGLITITRRGELYLSRTLPAPLARGADPETLLVELQRSLDYFESSFRQPPIMNVVVTPATERATELVAFLQSRLHQRVALWDIGRSGEWTSAVEIPHACVLTLGAALREEKVAL